VPLCGGDPADTRNFDAEFTKLNVKDSTHNGQEPDSVLEYAGFSFLDEEYRALRSHEHESSSDMRLSTDLSRISVGSHNESGLATCFGQRGSSAQKLYDEEDTDTDTDLSTRSGQVKEGCEDQQDQEKYDDDGPIDF
jgi:hypothetical protein